MVFVADVEMAVNFCLLSGESNSDNNFEVFLLQPLSHLQNKKYGYCRQVESFIVEILETFIGGFNLIKKIDFKNSAIFC